MASIDKTYTNSYQEYKTFKDWADAQFLTFYNGYTVCIGDWVWKLEESDFDGTDRAIMNTPPWLDIYLIQNCKQQFVLDRLRPFYNDNEVLTDLTAPPPVYYVKNRRISLRVVKGMLRNRPYRGTWWLQSWGNFWYHDDTKTWSDGFYPINTNTAHINTVKAVVRHLRNQHLPKGAEFLLLSSYGEVYRLKTI